MPKKIDTKNEGVAGSPVELQGLDEVSEPLRGQVDLIMEQADIAHEVRTVLPQEDVQTPRFSQLFKVALSGFREELKNSQSSLERARQVLAGEGYFQVVLPREDWRDVFPKKGKWISEAKGEAELSQKRTNALRTSLDVQTAEHDSALLRAHLECPTRKTHGVLEVEASDEDLVLRLSQKVLESEAEIPELSLKVDADVYKITFDENPLTAEAIGEFPLEEMDRLLKQLEWLESFLRHVMGAQANKNISIEVQGLVPVHFNYLLKKWRDADGTDSFTECFKLIDLLGVLRLSINHRKKAKKMNLTTKTGVLKEVYCPGKTLDCIEQHGFNYESTFEQDGFTFYLLPVKKVGTYLKCLFYVYDGTKLLPRVAYKSQSHQCWRIDSANSAIDYEEQHYGKGVYSYTVETIPCPQLNKLLMDMEKKVVLKDESDEEDIGYDMDPSDVEVNTYVDEVKLAKKLPGIDCEDLQLIRPQSRQVKTLIEKYFPKTFMPDFSTGPVSTRKEEPTEFFPQGYTVEEYHFTYKGNEMRLDLAYSPDGQVWPVYAQRLNVPINSYGIASEVLRLGPLNLKPYEYARQVDEAYKEYLDPVPSQAKALKGYINVTRLFDLLPLIKEFRKQRKVKRL
ncbi:MAG: hypothetical protein AAB383_06745 [Patescibacteria group bacterium]